MNTKIYSRKHMQNDPNMISKWRPTWWKKRCKSSSNNSPSHDTQEFKTLLTFWTSRRRKTWKNHRKTYGFWEIVFFATRGLFDRKSSQNDPKMPPKWRPKRSQNVSKNDVEKTTSKWCQNDLKIKPKWSQNASRNDRKSKKNGSRCSGGSFLRPKGSF